MSYDHMDDQLIDTPKGEQSFEAQVLQARSYGLGRNETAHFLKVSTYQVDKASKVLGIEWGGDHLAAANTARAEQAKKSRLELAEKFRKIANTELDSIIAGMASPGDRKDMVTIAAISVDKDIKISESLGENPEDTNREQVMERFDRFMYGIKASAHDEPDRPEDH